MELMKQFKAQTVSSIGGFLRQLSERKDIEIQKCNFIKEMNEMTGVYIVANDKEAVVLAVDARQEDTDELVDECPFHGEEPQWFSTSNHRVSPIYLMRQVMSLLELCYRKADMSNIEIGGTLLSFSALTDTGHFENLFDQLNICVLDELNAKEDYLLLREHFVDGNSTQKVLKDLFSSYYLVGLPDLVHSDDYIPKQEEPTHQEDETPDFVLPALDGEELGDFEHDLQELFGSFESHDTPPEEHRASAQEPVDDARLESITAHAALCGASTEVSRALMRQVTTDGCLAVLEDAGLREKVTASLLAAMQRHLERRAGNAFTIGAITFSNQYGLLGMTEPAETMLRDWGAAK